MSKQEQFSFFPPAPIARNLLTVIARYTDQEAEAYFDDWWSVCWKKEAKGAARRAYFNALRKRGATPQQLKDGAIKYAQFLQCNPRRPAKHPATWLNAECWTDELTDDRGSAERSRSSAHAGAARLFSNRGGLR